MTDQIHQKAYRMAVKAGVKIALGMDLGPSIPGSILSHGNNGQELKFAVKAGMTPLGAIEATTANAPSILGPQALSLGSSRRIMMLILLHYRPIRWTTSIYFQTRKMLHMCGKEESCLSPRIFR